MAAAVEEMVDVGDGARLWSVTDGTGRPVVWSHGGPGGTDNLGPVAAMITDLVKVHRYEQRACGRSSGGPPFTMAQAVADLDALRRHWGHARWVVAGHSFGAALALAYALEHPGRTDAVIYLSCIVRLAGQPDWHEHYRRARLERLSESRRGRFLELRSLREHGRLDAALEGELRALAVDTEFGDPHVAERMRPRLLADLALVNNHVNRELGADFGRYFVADGVRRRLHALDLPVLLVHGTADPRPIAAVEAIARELPRATLVRLESAGHLPFWESPASLRAALRDFLGSLAS
jgi:proline iminopeptidase